jgi:hypothetical protein
VNKGKFIYRWIDTDSADIHENILNEGDVVRQKPGLPHQLESMEDGEIFEVSTTHSDHDSYRVFKGDSQNKINN